MAKSKEQKQKEAIERKVAAFYEKSLISFTQRMPGGDFFDVSTQGMARLLEAMEKVQRMSKEAGLNFEGEAVHYCSAWEWPIELNLRWFTARNNWLDFLFKAQLNFNKTIGNGEVPFQANMNRFDSDMAKLVEALGPEK